MSIAVLAQALPSASSGMDWLYQFTNKPDEPHDTERRRTDSTGLD